MTGELNHAGHNHSLIVNQPAVFEDGSRSTFVVLGCQEIDVGGSRKAIIIFVPVPQLKSFQKIQVRLVRELEKKFSGKHVVFVAQVRSPVSDPGRVRRPLHPRRSGLQSGLKLLRWSERHFSLNSTLHKPYSKW